MRYLQTLVVVVRAFGSNRRQTFPYRILEGLQVTREQTPIPNTSLNKNQRTTAAKH